MATTKRASARKAAAKLAEHGIQAAEAYRRGDLADRLRDLYRLTAEPTVRVLVAGEFKQGKSSLVNALAGSEVCPVDDDVATAVATAVHHADAPVAWGVFAGDDGEPERREIDPEALPDWVTEDGQAPTENLQLVDVGVPAPELRGGLVLVDLPGAGGLGSFHGAATLAALRHAHAVLFVSDAVQELTAPERDFLAAVAARCAKVALVKTKTDIHPAWHRIVDADRGHAGEWTPSVFGVSAELAAKGRESDDPELIEESAVPELADWLRADVLARADTNLAASVADEVLAVCEQLRAPFEAQRAVLEGGADRGALEARLSEAQSEADRLRDAASRWYQVLGDAFGDISSDIDHDLRARVRDVVRRSEEAVDAFDPASAWEEYAPAFRREVAGLVADHYATLHDRVAEAAQRVTEVFETDAAEVDELLQPARDRTGQLASTRLEAHAELGESKRMGLGGQALGLVKASYGPSLMIGFIGGIAGLTIAAPAMLAVGVMMGSRGLRQEKQRQLEARRAQAKAAARKFVDEVVFEVAKDSRDEVRRAQRTLRDHFTRRAQELVRSANAAVQAAREATGGDEQTRARRHKDVAAELERLAWLDGLATRVRGAVEAAP